MNDNARRLERQACVWSRPRCSSLRRITCRDRASSARLSARSIAMDGDDVEPSQLVAPPITHGLSHSRSTPALRRPRSRLRGERTRVPAALSVRQPSSDIGPAKSGSSTGFLPSERQRRSTEAHLQETLRAVRLRSADLGPQRSGSRGGTSVPLFACAPALCGHASAIRWLAAATAALTASARSTPSTAASATLSV